jgi:hypothetical protein
MKGFTPMADYQELIFDNGLTEAAAGELLTKNSVYGFPLVTVSAGAKMALVVVCSKVKAKKAEDVAIEAGEAVFYDSSKEEVTTVADDNIFIGFAIENAGATDEYGYVFFDGTRAYTRIGGIEDIPDVNITEGPYNDNVLIFDHGVWKSSALFLDDLYDVDAGSPVDGQQLTWVDSTSKWESGASS